MIAMGYTAAAIARLEHLLGLKAGGPTCQDWDIELADPDRLGEFLNLYEGGTLNTEEKFALMSLILASFDELVSSGGGIDMIWGRIRLLLLREPILHRATVKYWSCPEANVPDEQFHATPYVRQLQSVQYVISNDTAAGRPSK